MLPVLPALLVLLGSARGEALAVVDTASPDELTGLAFQVTKAVVEAAEAQGYQVMTSEQLRKGLDERALTQLRACGGQPSCAGQYLRGTGAKKAVLGSLSRDDKSYLLKLWLIDLDRLSVVADVDRAILIAARRFQKDVQQAVPPLLRGEREARGTLVVRTTAPNVQVSLNGEFVGLAPVELRLRPGKYEVRAEKKGYLPVTRLLGVEAKQTTTEVLKLLLQPGEPPDPDLVAARAGGDAPGAAPTPRGLRLEARTWVAAGVAMAAVGVGTAFGVMARSADSKLLDGYQASTGTYAGTRVTAVQVQRDALIANVAFAVSAGALVTTAVFAALDASSVRGEQAGQAVRVSPWVHSAGSGLAVGGRF